MKELGTKVHNMYMYTYTYTYIHMLFHNMYMYTYTYTYIHMLLSPNSLCTRQKMLVSLQGQVYISSLSRTSDLLPEKPNIAKFRSLPKIILRIPIQFNVYSLIKPCCSPWSPHQDSLVSAHLRAALPLGLGRGLDWRDGGLGLRRRPGGWVPLVGAKWAAQ